MDFTTNLALDERVSSLFQPDTLLPDQYLGTFRRKFPLAPEKRLMMAILQDAIDCYRKYLGIRDRKRKGLFADAETWIFGKESDDWLFSFENICEVLGLSPHYMRRELLQWKLHHIARAHKKRLPRGRLLMQPSLFN